MNERIPLDQEKEVIELDDNETIFISASNTRLAYVPSDINELSQNRRITRRIEGTTSSIDMVYQSLIY